MVFVLNSLTTEEHGSQIMQQVIDHCAPAGKFRLLTLTIEYLFSFSTHNSFSKLKLVKTSRLKVCSVVTETVAPKAALGYRNVFVVKRPKRLQFIDKILRSDKILSLIDHWS